MADTKKITRKELSRMQDIIEKLDTIGNGLGPIVNKLYEQYHLLDEVLDTEKELKIGILLIDKGSSEIHHQARTITGELAQLRDRLNDLMEVAEVLSYDISDTKRFIAYSLDLDI